jgi:hypothetical protein
VSTAVATLALATAIQQSETAAKANLSSQILSATMAASAVDTRVNSVSSALAANTAALNTRLDSVLPMVDARMNNSLNVISNLIGGQLGVTLQSTNTRLDQLSAAINASRDSAAAQAASLLATQASAATFSTQVQSVTSALSNALADGLRSAAVSAAAISTQLSTNTATLRGLFDGLSAAAVAGQTSVATFSTQVTGLTNTLSAAIVTATASLARTSTAVVDTVITLSSTSAIANAASAGVIAGQTVPFFQYDNSINPRNVVSMMMAMSQALCVTRHGLWDPVTRTCGNPLAYGTVSLTRLATVSDATTFASCPAGFVPADCMTAFLLLRDWRMDVNSGTPNGDVWCSGSAENRNFNTDNGKRGMPGFWAEADSGGQRTMACPVGSAMVVDQCGVAISGCSGWRPHWYCRGEGTSQPWMCVALNHP